MDGVTFISFSLSDFLTFRGISIADYARELVASGQSAESCAVQNATNEFDEILPDGFETPNHFFRHIANARGENIGFIWFERRDDDVFICDFAINENQRGKGLGRESMRELERVVREMGTFKISLHVFEHNAPALALYRSMGYQASSEDSGSCFMEKMI